MTLDRLDDWFCDNWRQAWRWLSVQMHAFATAVLFVVTNVGVLPGPVVAMIPQPWANIVLAVWGVLGVVARLIKQKEAPNAGTGKR